ncbi:MAG: phosphotransferase [Chloroflexi bacterium]|nr:phosphotransferase [Chloroflexota bacterium]
MTELLSQLRSLISDEIELIAIRSLQDQGARLAGAWTVEKLGDAHSDPRTEAILKISGSARVAVGVQPWSSILKVVNSAAVNNQDRTTHLTTDSELGLLQSGVHADIKGGIRPVRCFGVDDREDGRQWIWQEDMSRARGLPWFEGDYAQATLDAGRLNGAWPDRVARDAPWLNTNSGIARWNLKLYAGPLIDAAASHPRFASTFTPRIAGEAKGAATLIRAYEKVVADLPKCFSHGDCHSRNLFLPEGRRTETVAIDWAAVGTDSIGIDGGTVIGSSLAWYDGEVGAAINATDDALNNYLRGMREVGWEGDDLTATVGFYWPILNYGAFSLFIIPWITQGWILEEREFIESRFGHTIEDLPQKMLERWNLVRPMFDDARKLLRGYQSAK